MIAKLSASRLIDCHHSLLIQQQCYLRGAWGRDLAGCETGNELSLSKRTFPLFFGLKVVHQHMKLQSIRKLKWIFQSSKKKE